jgi:peroxiredoxin (alkyl hydroperoxide reductase subunit C)
VSVIAAGTPAPQFSLTKADGGKFTQADLVGKTTLLIFYPFAFSGGCTDQLTLYESLLDDIAARGATAYAVSTDAIHSQRAFKEHVGSSIEQLSDFEPKGASAKAFGVLHPSGMTGRALVIIDPSGVVSWSYEAEELKDIPAPALILEGLDAV